MSRFRDQADLIRNLEAVAAQLAGRRVTVCLDKPPGLIGATYKNMQGDCVIKIAPSLLHDVRAFAETFTHEAAHARLHFILLPRVDPDAAPQLSEKVARLVYARRSERPADRRHEAEANALAARWMKAVHEHYAGYLLITHDPLFSVLQILYHKA